MGLRLISLQTGAEKEIPSEAVRAAILSGKFGAPAGSKIPVQFSDGEFGTVPVELAYEQFRRGASYDPPEAQEQRAREKKFGGRGLEAAGLGALSGLTLGASGPFLRATGMVTAAEQAGLEEYNPEYRVADVLASVVPAFATGGAGALAKGGVTAGKLAAETAVKEGAEVLAKKAAPGLVRQALSLTPPALVVRAGRAVERTTAAILGEAAERHVVGKIVPKLAGAALEGGVFGGAMALDESALGDTDLTAEQWWAGVKKGAVFGLGTAGVLGGTSALVENALRPALSKAVKRYTSGTLHEFFEEKADDLSLQAVMGRRLNEYKKLQMAHRRAVAAAGGMAFDEAGELASINSRLTQLQEMARKEVLPKVGWSADVHELSEGTQRVVREYRESLGQRYKQLDDLALTPESRINTYAVAEDLRAQAKEADRFAAADSHAYANFLRGEADRIEDLGGTIPTKKGMHGMPRPVSEEIADRRQAARHAADAVPGAQAKAAEARRLGTEAIEEAEARAVNDAAEAARLRQRAEAGEGLSGVFEKVEKAEEIADDSATVLMRARLKHTEAVQKAETAARSAAEKARSAQQAYDDILAQRAKIREHTVSFREYQVQRAKAAPPTGTYTLVEPSWKIEAQKAVAVTWNAKADEKASVLAKAAGFADDFNALRRKYSLAEQLDEFIAHRLAATSSNNTIPLTGVIGGVGAAVSGDAGALVSLGKGVAVAGSARWLMDRGRLMAAKAADALAAKTAKLRVISAKATETARRTQGAVDAFLESARHAAVPLSVKVLARSTFDGPQAKGRDRAKAYAARVQEIRQLASNPQQLIERVARSHSHMNDAAPKVSAKVQSMAIAEVTYLNNSIYRDPYSDSRILAHLEPQRTPEWAMARFLREYAAFEDAVGVLEELASGTLNRDGWKYIQRFRPRLAGDFRLKLTEGLARMTEAPDYRLRLRLEQIGIPAEPTARPEVMAAIQAAAYMPSGEPMRGGGGPGGRSVRGDAARTHTDRVAAGRHE